MIIDSGRCNIRMPQPLLHLGNVGPVIQCIGRSRRPHYVRPHVLPENAQLLQILQYYLLVYVAWGQCRMGMPMHIVLDRPKQGRIRVQSMSAINAQPLEIMEWTPTTLNGIEVPK